mmetsp:Transcript_29314/g.91092  ORF Transcript_29314/g.91092 Transcript_29314/m.91092 type:complete len:373 (+) Transcript_29314:62-1180(+)
MTSSAFIAHVLDPLIDPQFAEQDLLFDKTFTNSDDQIHRDHLRGIKRTTTYGLDWAGDKLLVATKDNNLRLFDPERDSEAERSWPGEWMAVECDPNDPHIAAAVSWTGKFLVFDSRAPSSSAIFNVDLKETGPNLKEFLVLCWAPDSKHIAVNNRQDQVYLLDLRQPGSLRLGASKNMAHEVNGMVWTTEGDALWIATGGTPGKIHALPAPSLQNEGAMAVTAHQYAAISLAADPTGKYIASGGGDCLVTLWDPKHLVCTRSFGYATQAVTTLGFNHAGSLLAWGTGGSGAGGGEKNLTIVGANTGNLCWQDATPVPVQQLKWHRKRNTLAYTLGVSQQPEERDRRMISSHSSRDSRDSRDSAVVHIMRMPE